MNFHIKNTISVIGVKRFKPYLAKSGERAPSLNDSINKILQVVTVLKIYLELIIHNKLMALYTTDYNIGLGRKWVWREWGTAGQVNGRRAGPWGGKAGVPPEKGRLSGT